MASHAAFLRGMNVGGHRISNAELIELFVGLGFGDVQAFRASGNVAFSAEASAATLARSIEQGLQAALGYAVPTFLRTAAELRKIAAASPFGAEQAGGRPQVALLSRRADAAARREVLALAGENERLTFAGRELHWLPSAGVLGSELDLALVEARLGPITLRTKGTIELFAARSFGG